MFLLNPQVIETKRGLDGAFGYKIEGEDDRVVWLWFDESRDDFIKKEKPLQQPAMISSDQAFQQRSLQQLASGLRSQNLIPPFGGLFS